eukprot:SAG31_NODE_1180_length_9525_cov_4.989497_8_plen_257_part_00
MPAPSPPLPSQHTCTNQQNQPNQRRCGMTATSRLLLPLLLRVAGAAAQEGREAIASDVGTLSEVFEVGGVAGHTTYHLKLVFGDIERNVYTIFGTAGHIMRIPPAYQVAAPFGANVGGTNPAFWSIVAGCQFDSWLTASETAGNVNGEISAIGIDFASWLAPSAVSYRTGRFSQASAPPPRSAFASGPSLPSSFAAVAFRCRFASLSRLLSQRLSLGGPAAGPPRSAWTSTTARCSGWIRRTRQPQTTACTRSWPS